MNILLNDKIKREDLQTQIDLDITFSLRERGRFTEVAFEGEDEEIFKNFLLSNYRRGYLLRDIEKKAYWGRLNGVGQFGYGVYCDISAEKDVLLDLHYFRREFGGMRSLRQYIWKTGLIEGLWVRINITRVEIGTERIWGELDKEWKKEYLQKGNILVSGVDFSYVLDALMHSPFSKKVVAREIYATSSVLACKRNTQPQGVVHLLGKRLKKARFGIVGEY
ncbi:MAG: hypothetical protein ACXQTP_04500 [Candidatus Methanofastidiosia archaeon]